MNRQSSLRMSGAYATGEDSGDEESNNDEWATIHVKTIDSIFSMSLPLSSSVGKLREMVSRCFCFCFFLLKCETVFDIAHAHDAILETDCQPKEPTK